jgi:hypothetical protein
VVKNNAAVFYPALFRLTGYTHSLRDQQNHSIFRVATDAVVLLSSASRQSIMVTPIQFYGFVGQSLYYTCQHSLWYMCSKGVLNRTTKQIRASE